MLMKQCKYYLRKQDYNVLRLDTKITKLFLGIIIVLVGMASAGSSFYSLMPFVLREIVGLENVTVALGIQTFFQSLGIIGSTSVSGMSVV